LPTFQVAEDFALRTATASFSLLFTAPLLAAEIFGCWPSDMELPAAGGYVGTVSGDLPHWSKDVYVH